MKKPEVKQKKTERIFVTLHYLNYGIAYLKHILSAFYSNKIIVDQTQITGKDIKQEEMQTVFDTPGEDNSFMFDKIYFLYPDQKVIDKITTMNALQHKKKWLEKDEELVNKKTLETWKELVKKELTLKEIYEQIKEKKNSGILREQIWRCIHHYNNEEQIWWLKNKSNFKNIYKDRLEDINITKDYGIKDLRNISEIGLGMNKCIKEIAGKYNDAEIFICTHDCTQETYAIWFALAEAKVLPPKTRFFSAFNNKDTLDNNMYFFTFNVKEIPSDIIPKVRNEFNLFKNPQSLNRKMAEMQMQHFLNSGFSIVILGERGTGKSHLANANKGNKNFNSVNCASFDDDNKAESELFGHEKGAFTGAVDKKIGLLEESNNGILLLDEVHYLSKVVQAKLMKALGDNSEKKIKFRPLGSTKEKECTVTLIFASNLTIEELHKKLLPDFYDRIAQNIIELPPFRKSKNDILFNLQEIWKYYRFNTDQFETLSSDKKLLDWINTLELKGNYRDLQKIAIAYREFLNFDVGLKKMISEKNPFDYTKKIFEKFHIIEEEKLKFTPQFSPNISFKETENLFKKQFAEWIIEYHGSAKNASMHLEKLGDKTQPRTLYNWRNNNFE